MRANRGSWVLGTQGLKNLIFGMHRLVCSESGVAREPGTAGGHQIVRRPDRAVLDCMTTPVPDNGFTATCHAVRAGTVTLTTMTAPFAGDPHGPPQSVWQLTVRVTG